MFFILIKSVKNSNQNKLFSNQVVVDMNLSNFYAVDNLALLFLYYYWDWIILLLAYATEHPWIPLGSNLGSTAGSECPGII